MLTPKQYRLLMFINKTIKENGTCPSYDEMKNAIGLKSKSGIYALIDSLVERNFVRKLPYKARAIEVVRLPKLKPASIIAEEKAKENSLPFSTVEIPLYKRSSPQESCLPKSEENINLPFSMIQGGDFFAIKIDNNAMKNAGIIKGDTAIIKKSESASNGDIALVTIENKKMMVREIKKDAGTVCLIAKNDKYPSLKYPYDKIKFLGTIKSLIRNYN